MKNKDIKKKLKPKKKRKPTHKDFLSTGSTILNCACTDNPEWGFLKGGYYWLVGDSTSGKTWLSLTCLAEACLNDNFKNYRFVYDNAEKGALMNIKRFFGRQVFKRMCPPNLTDSKRPIHSSTIEEFYFNLDDQFNYKKPFIYIMDSMDSLSSKSEKDKFQKTKKARRSGKETPGTMMDGKAKANSTNLRQFITPLNKTGSILILISQTRSNIGFGSQFNPKTSAGGNALKFYADLEIWSSVKSRIKKTVRGKARQLGVLCRIKTKKNRITGKERDIEIPYYHSFGIDDIGSCIDYLIDEKHWKTKKNKIKAPEFDFVGIRKKLIRYIEDEGMEKDLRSIVGDVWNEIENACKIKRKRKYE